jgi:pyruvate/2-oxoglutarate dehydrogenase complex dihydrolipoamide dehydrogenase (E3) component
VREVDVVVLGAGPAGENVAGRCAEGGLEVAIVERELVGGECSYWGCIPSKTLARPGDLLAAARRVPAAAAAMSGRLDAAAAFERRDKGTSSWHDEGQLPWLQERGVELVRGHGRLTGERRVEVTSADGSIVGFTARRAVVIATGTVAAIPPIQGLREANPWTNREVTAADHVPERLLVIGGGTIGVEMAQTYRRLGSRDVVVIEAAERVLLREEPFAGAEVAAALRAEGITVVTGVGVTAVERGEDVSVTLADGRSFHGDEVLVAVGRRPSTMDIGLATVGLEPGSFVQVDDHLRVDGTPWLYAVGDCNGRALLTHMGKYHARIAADVILGKEAAVREIVPRVTFTDPQVCAVGLTEAAARDAGLAVRVVEFPTGDVSGAWVQGDGITGTSKLVIDSDARVLVGATFTGPGVQELLHSATVAIVGRVTLDDLWHAVPSYPTVSEVWLRLLEAYGL